MKHIEGSGRACCKALSCRERNIWVAQSNAASECKCTARKLNLRKGGPIPLYGQVNGNSKDARSSHRTFWALAVSASSAEGRNESTQRVAKPGKETWAVTHTGGDSSPCSCERLLRNARRCDVMWHCCQLQSSGGGETTVRNASNRIASEPNAQRSKRPPP